jgi:hypothetical protein
VGVSCELKSDEGWPAQSLTRLDAIEGDGSDRI